MTFLKVMFFDNGWLPEFIVSALPTGADDQADCDKVWECGEIIQNDGFELECGGCFPSRMALLAHQRRFHGCLDLLSQCVLSNACPMCFTFFFATRLPQPDI